LMTAAGLVTAVLGAWQTVQPFGERVRKLSQAYMVWQAASSKWREVWEDYSEQDGLSRATVRRIEKLEEEADRLHLEFQEDPRLIRKAQRQAAESWGLEIDGITDVGFFGRLLKG